MRGSRDYQSVLVHNCFRLCFRNASHTVKKKKGQMEAENPVACCFSEREKNNLGCHGSKPQGTGVHMRCCEANRLMRSKGSCRAN